jgi:hypothetical protein
MRKYEGKLAGILGTAIIHLIAGIIFMSLQIKMLQKDHSDEFMVEIASVPESGTKEKLIELPGTTVDKILQGDEEMLNIARNLSNKAEPKINAADYIDMVKDELIKSGKLGVNNYIDEQKRLNEMKGNEELSTDKEAVNKDESNNLKESKEIDANYQGPTRIYYDLAGRTHRYLPIPIYKCQGSGKVVLAIEVNQNGIVEKAVVIANESTTSDICLGETAVATALISRFNPDINSPKTESGTLTYIFVAQ